MSTCILFDPFERETVLPDWQRCPTIQITPWLCFVPCCKRPEIVIPGHSKTAEGLTHSTHPNWQSAKPRSSYNSQITLSVIHGEAQGCSMHVSWLTPPCTSGQYFQLTHSESGCFVRTGFRKGRQREKVKSCPCCVSKNRVEVNSSDDFWTQICVQNKYLLKSVISDPCSSLVSILRKFRTIVGVSAILWFVLFWNNC